MIQGAVISGLFREVYGAYEGRFINDEHQVYRTTDRYFEKYVLKTDQGIYEIWAGGCRKKENLAIVDFKLCPGFDLLKGSYVVQAKCDETTLALRLGSGACFIVGLCRDINTYGHPERYIKLVKHAFDADDKTLANWFDQELKATEDYMA